MRFACVPAAAVVLGSLFLWGGPLSAAPAPPRGHGGHGPGASKKHAKEHAAGDDAPIRMTMEELHRHGGVPPGWRFRLPAGNPEAGRAAFVKFECFACHRVAGEKFPRRDPKPTEKGPDLTGMGAHHPAEYLFESILYPNRVIATGPGYMGRDGLSIMPGYAPLMTLEEAADLTAYIKNLTGGGGHGHAPPAAHGEKGAPHAGHAKASPGIVLRIEGGKLAGGRRVVRVKQGETVRLRWRADRPATVHLHGYDVERHIQPGAVATMHFVARAAGRFPITLHGGGHAHGEGGGHGSHGGEKVLIYLEVHPR